MTKEDFRLYCRNLWLFLTGELDPAEYDFQPDHLGRLIGEPSDRHITILVSGGKEND